MANATFRLVVVLALAAGSASWGQAQTTAPPAGDAHPDFSGTWSLDRTISIDPARISFGPAADTNRPQSRNRSSGFGGFRGGGIGGRTGRTPRTDDRNGTDALTVVELERLKVLTGELKAGSASLVISHHDPSFVVTNALDHAQFLQTDGTATEHQATDPAVPCSTQWEGARIVSECSVGSRLTLVYVYTLLAATNQLVVRIDRKDGQNRRPFDPDVKLVYKRSRPS